MSELMKLGIVCQVPDGFSNMRGQSVDSFSLHRRLSATEITTINSRGRRGSFWGIDSRAHHWEVLKMATFFLSPDP
jgi:hypothetical protein